MAMFGEPRAVGEPDVAHTVRASAKGGFQLLLELSRLPKRHSLCELLCGQANFGVRRVISDPLSIDQTIPYLLRYFGAAIAWEEVPHVGRLALPTLSAYANLYSYEGHPERTHYLAIVPSL
jgi:hypothetical protein